MLKRIILTILIVLSLFALLTCTGEKPSPQRKTGQHKMISAYTAGTISCVSPIRVRFISDIVDSGQVNIALKRSPFSFTPKLEGTAVWSNPRTLEFRPEKRFGQDKQYNVTLKLSDFVETTEEQETFTFQFHTMKQFFEITIDGLQAADPLDIRQQRLNGKIVTADTEDAANIVKMLKAGQSGNSLPVRWHHDDAGREHKFTVENIVREEDVTRVNLSWNGRFIDVDEKGSRIIDVPGLMTFNVTRARAVRSGEQNIEVRFSDPLEANQNLQGLIHIPNHKHLKFTINNNIVYIYSQEPWKGEIDVVVEAGIRNSIGHRLQTGKTIRVFFDRIKPRVRFAGKGAIIPTTQGLTIPFEAVNLKAVIVEAMRIHDQNMPQFLQINDLRGESEIYRVGRTVWKDVVELELNSEQSDRWLRYGLDIGPLVENNPGGLYRITLTFRRPHIAYPCETEQEEEIDLSFQNWDDNQGASNWDYWDEDFDWSEYYSNRQNPCHPAYYRKWYDHDITVSQNFLISDIGLIAKRGNNDSVFVAVTDIRTAEPLTNVSLKVLDFQQHIIGTGKTDGQGRAFIETHHKPYLLVASHENQWGYLKINDGSALSVSHFDVGGSTIQGGIKGFLYGERGVWRPGDPMYLTFILMDNGRLPSNHPVRFELVNPRGQLVETINQTSSLNGFYSFHVSTSPDDPTGNWLAKVKIGGVTFEKTLRVESVMPNRLKIQLDLGEKATALAVGELRGEISANWLHGAIAKYLKADMEVNYMPGRTKFDQYTNYVFDDPVRRYEPESQIIFEGELDENGKAAFQTILRSDIRSPGMLTAQFTTRVFESGGAFSTDRFRIPFHPYDRYIGILVPRGDLARNMLLTDTTHTVRIVRLSSEGNLQGDGSVEVKLYKIKWRWWWEKGSENLADYVGKTSYLPIQTDTVRISNGQAQWPLRILYPEWGRYLIRVRDLNGNHITGKIVYIDWPGWAGRGQEDQPGGATVLTFASDKPEYRVGEQAAITIPTGRKGRGLVSVESGTRIIQTDWIEGSSEPVRYSFRVGPGMAPNVYVHVTFVQPHLQVGNDLPIRLYGVIPIKVFDPNTRLEPRIEAKDVFEPEARASITVKEAAGKPMTYTLAVVDEGLLDLTRFETPNPWQIFYSREALGVKTWDLYEWVAGAYGGSLEKLLSIGGGDEGGGQDQRRANRFPPMVRFYGPFELKKNNQQTHDVDIPQYVGSVRVMVVAGQRTVYGSAEKAVFVRKPLMVLSTLPRVLSIEEEVSLPVSVFALEEKIEDVTVLVEVDGPISLLGSDRKTIRFSEIGDQMINFRLKAHAGTGVASVSIQANSGEEKAAQRIELDVRNPVGRVVEVVDYVLEAGKSWRPEIRLPGIPGTNTVKMEVSRIPPLNLGKRLDFLIQYPHGCVEQTTSAVFPQLYLNHLLDLSPEKKHQIEENIKAGILKLRSFQRPDGGFGYWEGANESDEWSSNYAGHFLIEARNRGYNIPQAMLEQWIQFQINRARSWVTGPTRSELIQAYRLYTLALSDRPELGSMNRLKEMDNLPTTARFQLAAAYQLAGQIEAARSLTRGNIVISVYRELSNTYGSDLRDKAMVLETLSLVNDLRRARPLVQEISETLSSDRWLSTQTTAYALIALARHAGVAGEASTMQFRYTWAGEREAEISTEYPMIQKDLSVGPDTTAIFSIRNSGNGTLYPRLILEGNPRMGGETASRNGMMLRVRYLDSDEDVIDPSRLEQGTDIIIEIQVTNSGMTGTYEEVALTHLMPSGWEIHNERLNLDIYEGSSDFEYQDIRDDRIYTYFDLAQGRSKTFRVLVNGSYLGKFYLPPIRVETMYDATLYARIPGNWVNVVLPDAE